LVSVCRAQNADTGPRHYTRAEFQSLRWLEGDWRGTGGRRPFFERYEMSSDTTIRIHYYADSTRTEERGSGSVYLSEGTVYHTADGATWVAVRFDSTGIYFAPHEGAHNSFRWTRLSSNSWEAVLRFEGGREARYELTRISK
jgi:hypothetical protein